MGCVEGESGVRGGGDRDLGGDIGRWCGFDFFCKCGGFVGALFVRVGTLVFCLFACAFDELWMRVT